MQGKLLNNDDNVDQTGNSPGSGAVRYIDLVSRSCFFQHLQRWVVLCSLTFYAAVTLIHELIHSRLDNCSSIYAGLPRVHRAAACLIWVSPRPTASRTAAGHPLASARCYVSLYKEGASSPGGQTLSPQYTGRLACRRSLRFITGGWLIIFRYLQLPGVYFRNWIY